MYTASYKEVSPLSICSRPAGQLKFESNYVYRLAIYKTQANIFWSFRRQLSKQSKSVESTAHAITKERWSATDGWSRSAPAGGSCPPPPPPPCPPPPPPPPPPPAPRALQNKKKRIRGAEFQKSVLFSSTTRFCDFKKNTKLLVVAYLYDNDNKLRSGLSPVRSGSRFLIHALHS